MAIPGSRPNNRLILVIGIVCAVLAFAGVLFLVKGGGQGPTQQVVVFKTDLTAGHILTGDDLTTATVSQSAVGRGALVDPTTAVGKQIVNNVYANDIVTQAVLAQPGSAPTGTASATNGLQLTKGYVALAIPTSLTFTTPSKQNPYALTGGAGDLMSVGYYITPGDHIDVLVWNSGKIRFAFQDLRVIKVGDNPGGATTAAASSASGAVFIVEVPRAQAEILAALFRVTCNSNADTSVQQQCVQPTPVSYVLRNSCDNGDPHYVDTVRQTLHDPSFTQGTALTSKQLTTLQNDCINPYPNYVNLTNPAAGFPNQITPPADGGETPQQLAQLFP